MKTKIQSNSINKLARNPVNINELYNFEFEMADEILILRNIHSHMNKNKVTIMFIMINANMKISISPPILYV